MADDTTPPLPGWEYTDGIGYTRQLGPLHLHTWKMPAQDAFPWSVRLKGFLVTSCWKECEDTATAIHAMEAAERAARAHAESILRELP